MRFLPALQFGCAQILADGAVMLSSAADYIIAPNKK